MKKIVSALVAFVALSVLVVLASPAQAGTATANLNVSVTVDAACTLTSTPLAFSDYSPLNENAENGTGTLVLICTAGIAATIDLDMGAHAISSQRNMSSGAGTITYNVYQDAGRSIAWSNGSNGLQTAAAPDTNPRTYTVYGIIPPQQSVTGGAYYDTLVATVNF